MLNQLNNYLHHPHNKIYQGIYMKVYIQVWNRQWNMIRNKKERECKSIDHWWTLTTNYQQTNTIKICNLMNMKIRDTTETSMESTLLSNQINLYSEADWVRAVSAWTWAMLCTCLQVSVPQRKASMLATMVLITNRLIIQIPLPVGPMAWRGQWGACLNSRLKQRRIEDGCVFHKMSW